MKFIFLGAPGAGKGTLAVKAAQEYGIVHISTGEIFRTAIREKTPLGLTVQAIIDSGALVGDDITVALVKDRVNQKDAKNGFILDGFPRTIMQAEELAKILTIDAVVNFDISDTEVISRLSGRRMCKKCSKGYHVQFMPPKKEGTCDVCGSELITREDDKLEAIAKRLEVYKEQTEPLIAYYREKNLLIDIDARPAAQDILDKFKILFPKS